MNYQKYYDKAQSFLQNQVSGIELITNYIDFANHLLYLDESTVLSVIDKLKTNIVDQATQYSAVYQNYSSQNIYSRSNMLDLDHWFVPHMKNEIQMFSTSGSTSGESFRYGIWKKYVSYLEDECHYGMILDEFGIPKNNTKILVLLKLPYNPSMLDNTSGYIIQTNDSPYTMHTHKSTASTRYFPDFRNYDIADEWSKSVLDISNNHGPFDILISSGPFINRLVQYIRKYNYAPHKIAKLMSHTTQKLLIEDAEFLIGNGFIDYCCDHMRCWDGGAMFFTCKNNTYHLCDHLSWVEQGPDNQMLTTDYFSLPAPFINYWNGDLCEIENSYSRCDCGRLYRPFKMLDNRPFGLKGATKLTEIKKQIRGLDYHHLIDHIQFANLDVYITTNTKLSDQQKEALANILNEYTINYIE